MAIIAGIVVGVALGLSYSRKGLFLASMALVAVFLSITAALGFGATVVHTIGVESEYAYSITMFAIALFAFMIIRGALVFIDDDVDFHPFLERAGGAVLGLATGLLAFGFVCVCLLCMPFPKLLSSAEDNTAQATAMILLPCQAAAKLLPGEQPLQLDTLLVAAGRQFSPYEPPPPPPKQSPDDDMPVESSEDIPRDAAPPSEDHPESPR